MAFDPINSGTATITLEAGVPFMDAQRYREAVARTTGMSLGTLAAALPIRGSLVTILATPLGGATFNGWIGGLCAAEVTTTCTFIQPLSTGEEVNFIGGPGTFYRPNGLPVGLGCGCDPVIYQPPIMPGDFFDDNICSQGSCDAGGGGGGGN